MVGGGFNPGTAGDLVVRVLGLGAVRADVVIRALAASGDVNIISRPLILAQNNEEARFLVGDERPFIQVSRTLPTDSPVRDEVVQYRDVGTELTIRPTINPDGYVTLDILQEVSTASRATQFGAPIINTREAKTKLLIKDRHTAIIGGLIREQEERTSSGIPIFRDLPLIGRLFRSETRSTEKTELFVLLTPRVLRTDEDMEDATRNVADESRSTEKILRSYDPVTGQERPLQPRPEN
jgi:general secretion pathway protein D